MRIDSHQHFWSYAPAEYPWIGEEAGILKHDYLPKMLEDLLILNGMDGSVAVQARQTEEETEWLLQLAATYHWIRGVVGWVDLKDGTCPAQLGRFAEDSTFKGVRYPVPSPGAPAEEQRAFTAGMNALGSHNLTFDLLIRPDGLEPAMALADAFPNQVFILDHIAKPGVAAGRMEPWAAGIADLARRENVFCKVSGMITEADRRAWEPGDFRPYLDKVFEAFGVERLMFGSDWPVCLLAGSYADVVSVVSSYVEDLSVSERDAVWGGTAVRVYGLSRISENFNHSKD